MLAVNLNKYRWNWRDTYNFNFWAFCLLFLMKAQLNRCQCFLKKSVFFSQWATCFFVHLNCLGNSIFIVYYSLFYHFLLLYAKEIHFNRAYLDLFMPHLLCEVGVLKWQTGYFFFLVRLTLKRPLPIIPACCWAFNVWCIIPVACLSVTFKERTSYIFKLNFGMRHRHAYSASQVFYDEYATPSTHCSIL